ncbi:MAG: polysaccharide pyruvyl transferase family protein [Candidatus Thiodiazotropha sp.]
MKSVSIIAATISGNRGAEAMLTTTIGEIRQRYPDCHFNVYSYYPTKDRALVSDRNISIYSATPLSIVTLLFPFSILYGICKFPLLNKLLKLFPSAIKALDTSDLLLDLAGVAFIDGREKFLPYNVLTLAPAFILKTPVIKLSQALGPFDNRFNRMLAVPTLKRCQQIFARGQGTHQNLKSIGLHNLFPTPVSDVAFLHQAKYSLTDENLDKVSQLSEKLRNETKRVIGICPSSVLAAKLHDGNSHYIESLIELCNNLISQGFTILLFPNATRADQEVKLRNNDLPVIKLIHDRLIADNLQSQSVIYSVSFDINTNGIKQLMQSCKIVLVSRFHAMIAALSSQQPVIVIGWSHKYQEVMETFELGESVYDFSQIEMDKLISAINLNINAYDAIVRNLKKHKQTILESSSQQFQYLFNIIEQK